MVATGLLDHPFKDAYASHVLPAPAALESVRETARAVLKAAGLPGPKNEAWKFTSLNDLTKVDFVPAPARQVAIPAAVPTIAGARRVVLVNGAYSAAMSDKVADIKGLRVVPLSAAANPGVGRLAPSVSSPLVALNAAYASDGIVIDADKNFAGAVIHLISIGSADAPAAFHARNLVTLAPGAQLTLIESHVGAGPYFANPVTEIAVGENAQLRRYVAVQESDAAFHLATSAVSLAANAGFESFHLGLGGLKVRQELRLRVAGAGASAKLNGVYALMGKQHHDFTTSFDHAVPHGTSSQLFKGVVGGQSHAVFQGHILVAKDAQKTDARLLHKALFLTKGPTVDVKPELEIFADDVQCAHGAATGELDPNHLFYLMARGIDRDSARALLIAGYLDEVVETIADDNVRAAFGSAVHAWLAARGAA